VRAKYRNSRKDNIANCDIPIIYENDPVVLGLLVMEKVATD
jgi:hypothetical protein